jgi:hypothetical protein
MLRSDKFIDPEDVRDELRTELVLLNRALKQLAPDLDFSDALRPLLADTGPALAHAQRLARQKTRMEKLETFSCAKRRKKSGQLHWKDLAVQPDYLQPLFAI